ncbi:HAD-IA family hydrolase [Actinoplanes sp. NPDC049596]|uniref:HAD-IA family hydrolase n=1 Tax=unclassified Actinoplanes TaxID=2626549 RepID=UPI00341F419A
MVVDAHPAARRRRRAAVPAPRVRPRHRAGSPLEERLPGLPARTSAGPGRGPQPDRRRRPAPHRRAPHELGHRKPHREFFDAALARVGRPAHECLFIDDKQQYVDGAENAGIAAIRYRDNPQLIAELTSRGLTRG